MEWIETIEPRKDVDVERNGETRLPSRPLEKRSVRALNQRAVGSTPTRPTTNHPLTLPLPSSQSPSRHGVGS